MSRDVFLEVSRKEDGRGWAEMRCSMTREAISDGYMELMSFVIDDIIEM